MSEPSISTRPCPWLTGPKSPRLDLYRSLFQPAFQGQGLDLHTYSINLFLPISLGPNDLFKILNHPVWFHLWGNLLPIPYDHCNMSPWLCYTPQNSLSSLFLARVGHKGSRLDGRHWLHTVNFSQWFNHMLNWVLQGKEFAYIIKVSNQSNLSVSRAAGPATVLCCLKVFPSWLPTL